MKPDLDSLYCNSDKIDILSTRIIDNLGYMIRPYMTLAMPAAKDTLQNLKINRIYLDSFDGNNLTEIEKKNERDILEIRKKYFVADNQADYELKQKRYLTMIAPQEYASSEERNALGVLDPGTPEERKKLYYKVLNEYKEASVKNDKDISKENRRKYYMIYFLGNMGKANKEPINTTTIHANGTRIYSGEPHTIITSPNTGIGMKEAENYLLNSQWDLVKTYNQICADKGIKNEYDSIKYIGNVNTQFNSFFNRFDDVTRGGINKVALIIGGIILLTLTTIVLCIVIDPSMLRYFS